MIVGRPDPIKRWVLTATGSAGIMDRMLQSNTSSPVESNSEPSWRHHVENPDWLTTSAGVPRGYIQPQTLTELWFHTGTNCNLRCPFCLEGSHPGDMRLQLVTFDDVKPFMDEALSLGVEQYSFTGGEPFVNRDIFRILDYALRQRPCLVLTNGTKPLRQRFDEVRPLADRPNRLRFRVSLDYAEAERHDEGRGRGNFDLAVDTLGLLHRAGFDVSIARLSATDEDRAAVDAAYAPVFRKAGVPEDTHIVVFPDFQPPCSHPDGVPEITENCMTTYHTEASRAAFMCGFSKMVVKKDGRMRVYACTLVDDDDDYDLGGSLTDSMRVRVMLRHHRCFACFAHGASCSER